LQGRLALYGKAVGLLSFGFFVVSNGTAFLHDDDFIERLGSEPQILHLVGASVHLALWLVCSRWQLEPRTLRGMDALCTVVAIAIYAAMTPFQSHAPGTELVVVLCAICVLMARAVFVPSSFTRTLLIGLASSASVLGFFFAAPTPVQEGHLVGWAIYIALWATIGVILSALASRVIFGLRERARVAEQLGQYTLIERIGEGGMGEVYRAEHAMLRRPTAIKLLRPEAVGEQALRRFEREVTLTARLTHPNTIAVYDYGRTPEGLFYYAMEYLEGMNLQELVSETGPQPPERVAHILVQACDSLAEAHAAGLVHRDIKPANLVLCKRGRRDDVLKVLDFGLVKDLDKGGTDVSLTQANAIAGTPLYMAPEVIARPEAVDNRTDLYALGAVGWFLLAGRPVFEGRTIVEVCAGHLHAAPKRPSALTGHDVPRLLEDVVMKCLAKDPAERFATADVMRRAIDATGIAEDWTADRAAEWWRGRPDRPRSLRPSASDQRSTAA
jgi:serine/threonine-protein kinase